MCYFLRMPNKNTLKVYAPNHYYHVYNRGWNRSRIFLYPEDYIFFENLLIQRLSPTPLKDMRGREYMWLRETIDLNAYCLMSNHFHFLIYQRSEAAMTKLLQSVCTAYTLYFNRKYKKRGPLFETRFKAVLVVSDEQLRHITRYIHLNHWSFRDWPHNSYGDYLGTTREWLEPKSILELFPDAEHYRAFVEDYEAMQRSNDKLKRELASYTI